MTGLAERIERVAGPVHRPGHRWPLLAAAAVVLLIGLGWLVGFSSVLGVRTVSVSGEHRVTSAQILAAAGIRHGEPLARLDAAAVRARVGALPAVRAVTVHVSYPSTVDIRVTERTAVGYRPAADGVVLVDAADVEFATEPRPPRGLPELAGTGDQASAAAAATVAAALPAGFAGAVARIAVPTLQSITLTLTDGRTVLWGGTDRSGEKAKLVPVLVHQPGRYFDVSDPSSVISRNR